MRSDVCVRIGATGLPLADEVPMLFGGLPAHVLEDLGEFLVFTAVNAPDTMEQLAASRKATFARFMAIFIGDTRYATTSTSLSAPFPYLSLSSMPRCTCYVVRSAWCPCVSGADWC